MNAVGTTLLDRYTLKERLGSGGMAQVYRAFDAQRGCDVAVKILNDECAASTQLRERFLNECTLLKTLDHPHIVSVFELHESSEQLPFFSMELVSGATLAARKVGAAQPLSVSQLLTALLQVAGALEYLHTHNIIYCDLKPENIMVSVHENTLGITLIDFGVSQRISTDTTCTKTQGNLVGTSLYMSPEAIRGEPPTPRWDIYSFGALAFELLTGHVPFEQKELFSVTASHLLGKVPDISHYNPDVPRGMSRFIEICLAKEPADRYQSITEAADRLATLIEASSSQSILRRLLAFWQVRRRPLPDQCVEDQSNRARSQATERSARSSSLNK